MINYRAAKTDGLFAGSSPPLTVDNTKDLMSIHINQVILASYSK